MDRVNITLLKTDHVEPEINAPKLVRGILGLMVGRNNEGRTMPPDFPLSGVLKKRLRISAAPVSPPEAEGAEQTEGFPSREGGQQASLPFKELCVHLSPWWGQLIATRAEPLPFPVPAVLRSSPRFLSSCPVSHSLSF